MKKEFKVMRKKHSYRSGRNVLFRVIATVVVAAVLFAAGWFLYQPAYNWVMGLTRPQEESSSQSEQVAEEPRPQEEPQLPEPLPQNWSEELRAVWIPAEVSVNAAALESYLNSLPAEPVNAVVLELKNQKGSINYQTANETARLAGAQVPGAFDLAAVTDMLHQKGYLVLGRLYAFEDCIATAVLEEGKVRYAGTEYAWLDNSAAEGGKAWLNPYAPQAQDYVAQLAAEALDLGVDGLVLDGLQFPTGFSLNLADYGNTNDVARPVVLNQFAERVETLVEAKDGAGCWIYMDAAELVLPEEMGQLGPYGGNAAQVVENRSLMVNVRPAYFGIGSDMGITLPEKPVANPAATVAAALKGLKLSGDKAQVMPVLQAYTASDIASEFNLDYGQAEVEQQIDAALELGVRSVVLFDPSGEYSVLK